MSDCLFCRIIEKKIPAGFEYEDESVVVIRDINPQAPTHLLILPRKHIERIADLGREDGELIGKMVRCGQKLAKDRNLEEGYRLVFNNGPKAGQSVYHIHLHLLGGRVFNWPPG